MVQFMCTVSFSVLLPSVTISSVSCWNWYYENEGSFWRTESKLTQVPSDIPAETKMIYLQGNNITTIRTEAFHHIIDPYRLKLSDNSISVIEAKVFCGMSLL